MTDSISEQAMKMLVAEAETVYLNYPQDEGALTASFEHMLNHALEEGIVELPHPHYSSCYECPECHSEVDLREARAL